MRGNTLDTTHRTYTGFVRGTMQSADDQYGIQQVKTRLLYDDWQQDVERIQDYGFTSRPLPQKDGEEDAAEVLAHTAHGNRSHTIIAAIDDPRYRLKNIEEGESAQYDDQGQRVHIQRAQLLVRSHKQVRTEVATKKQQTQGQGSGGAGQGGSGQSGKSYGQDAKAEVDVKTSITQTDSSIILQVGNSTITITENSITLKSSQIVTDGQTLLGGPDASLEAAMRGTVDTGGYADKSNLATMVLVK